MAKVLIVGAGVAGDTLAVYLERAGWAVRVVEIADGPRSGGQTVDLRGPSAAVLADLGLLAACQERRVVQRGIAWVDADGHPRARMPVEAFGGQGFVSRDELLRTDLMQVVHAAAGPGVGHWFGETVESLEEVHDGVRAHFRHRPAEVFDLVVGADGAHSRVRALVFGPEEQFRRRLGLAHAWFSLTENARTPRLDGWFAVHNAPGGRVVEARPGHPGQQEAGFTFPAGTLPDRRDRAAQHALLERVFSGTGWRTEELLDAARAAPDFALDTFDQIRVDHLHEGRVVLLGDSAWCASPLSGLGTALALAGARTLAAALTDSLADAPGRDGAGLAAAALEDALAVYRTGMKPSVDAAQKLLPGRVRSYAPHTARGIRTVAALMRLVQAPVVAPLLTRLARG